MTYIRLFYVKTEPNIDTISHLQGQIITEKYICKYLSLLTDSLSQRVFPMALHVRPIGPNGCVLPRSSSYLGWLGSVFGSTAFEKRTPGFLHLPFPSNLVVPVAGVAQQIETEVSIPPVLKFVCCVVTDIIDF